MDRLLVFQGFESGVLSRIRSGSYYSHFKQVDLLVGFYDETIFWSEVFAFTQLCAGTFLCRWQEKW